MLLPLIARAAVAAGGLAHASGTRGSWRATWAYALLLTITTAFTPIVWPIALVLGVALLAVRRSDIVAYGLRFLVLLGTPLLLLAPGRCRCCPSASSRKRVSTTARARPPPRTCSERARAVPAPSAG
ncbi:hypothetical protein E4K10_17160 [Streptomyces sp. T1317-0309]|nr:hypothetical protein E4K10_17160 [Streptomyces sp. T1317-0309]